jgi:hypothetical protein
MNAIELLTYSLGNAFGILGQVTADLTQEQADWAPPGIANPIGATCWHTVSGTDLIVHKWCAGQAPLFESAGWREKVLLASGPEGEGETREHMLSIQVDLPELHAYSQAVAEAVQAWLSTLSPEDLDRPVENPMGEMNLGQVLEMFVIWHINAHCGEIAALKGCLGAKGYPF